METITEMLNSPATQALGWTLIHSLWQGALCYLLSIAVLRSIPTKHSEARYAASVAVLTLMLISSVVTFALVYAPATAEPTQSLAAAVRPVYDPVTTQATTPSAFHAILSQLNTMAGRQMGIVSALWLIGAVAFMLRIASGYWYVGFIRKSAQPINSSWQAQINELAAKINIDRFVEVAQSELINAPMVLGYLKPVIMIPVGMFSGLTTDQLEAIFVHELMHIKRRDYLVNLIQAVLEAIYFFNPFAWILSADIRREREHCCDDGVVVNYGNAMAYVRALATLEEVRLSRSGMALSLAEDKNQLLQRIKRIMEKSVHNYSSRDRFVPAILLVIGLMCASWLTIQTRDRKSVVHKSEETPDRIILPEASHYVAGTSVSAVLASDTTVKQQPGAYYHYSVTTIDEDGKEDTHVVEGFSEDGNAHDPIAGIPPIAQIDPLDPVEPYEPIIFEIDAFREPITVPRLDVMPVVTALPQPMVPHQFQMPIPPTFHVPRFDTIPSLRNNSWDEFGREFEETFKEKFEDFYNEHESDVKQMMKELEERFNNDESFGRRDEASMRREEGHSREWARATVDMARAGDAMHREGMVKMKEAQHAMELARVQLKIDQARIMDMTQFSLGMKDLELNMKKFEKELQDAHLKVEREAVRDGYLKKDEKINSININDDHIEINGKKIKDADVKRYRELLHAPHPPKH